MATEQLVFGTTMEGLFLKGLKGKISAQLTRELRERGLDLERPLLPAYPRQVVNEVIHHTAVSLFPEVPIDEAFYRVGKHVTPGQAATLLGSAALRLVSLVGPRRTLERLSRTFASTNNYMTVSLRKLADTSWELELHPSNAYPRYMQAVLEDMLTLAGAKDLTVRVAQHDTQRERCVYAITWR